MQKIKNKTMTIIIALILMISIGASMILVPFVSAHGPGSAVPNTTPWQIPTFAHIYAATDPIGVGQKASIYMWLRLLTRIQQLQTTTDSITTSSSSQRPAAK